MVTGEVPLALTAYAYKVEQLRKSGAPIDWLLIPPGVARFEGAGVTRRAAHPHAAILFFEFMLTDGRDILLERDFFPARANARSLPQGALVHVLDPAKALDVNGRWSKYFRDVVASRR